MKKHFKIRPIAVTEMEETYQWYESQREGLGDEFTLCVEEALEKIIRNPELYPIIHKRIRRALVRRFPYGIFYFTEGSSIVVIAIFHCSRTPKYWKYRV